ncbi:hypothetical protein [Arundinibacter roseus]|uniref:Uncharacterized protein n=1 Tax=Arundinibacter roseus TaxID=2070510 RepID=A0A4R4KLZ9_9BACT|nr:hypothetical protein [Arundinibacter roseus]TDB68002.1 hypothetical protein EZE20_03500 [Arundinibacter roseus]
MNSSKKRFIFASVLGVILFANPLASFSNVSKNDSSARAQVLSKGTEVKFSAYISENFSKFSKKSEWSVIERIVTQYSLSPSKLLSTPETDRVAFLKAVKSLNTKLNRQRGEEAIQWTRDLNKTVQQVQFIWNFDMNSLTPVVFETPLYVAPTAPAL